ncbi:MAG: DNA polymerase III subunit delta [Oscillospiraceae bacterium]|nr:DNA polymerase III subunit delta [Oscillospiraceae bacterium]
MDKFKKTKNDSSYPDLISAIKAGSLDKLYIFHGEERYLLDRCLISIRELLCPGGLDSFNYKRFDEKNLPIDEFEDAVNTMPAFAEKTLIEIHDFDVFKNTSKERLCDFLSDLPDYVCVIFVYNTVEFKPDSRLKINKEILNFVTVVDFMTQEQDKLVNWIKRHFKDAGKNISTGDAEYLAFITGGLMTVLNGEIEKTAAYSKTETITKTDIDAVVTPVLDAVTYKLTDALINKENKKAVRILGELYQMREAPHKIMSAIAIKIRQLLAARICLDNKLGKTELMNMCNIRHEFQARNLMATAGKTTLADCRKAVLFCSETAMELNSTAEPEAGMTELIAKLVLN